MISHNYVLIFEFKYNLIIMQLRLKPRIDRRSTISKILIKTILVVAIFLFVIFLLDRLEMPVPNKLIKQEISNDKLITLK